MQQASDAGIEVVPITGLPEVRDGDDLAALICERTRLQAGEIVAISQKIVSKAEGQVVNLRDVVPGRRAQELASEQNKDARLVELILLEADEVLRAERGVLITRTRHGFVCANSGIDTSNVPDENAVVLLPEDPDDSARRLRSAFGKAQASTFGNTASSSTSDSPIPPPAVVITDSFGRAWRHGQSETAIGAAGINVLDDWRGFNDSHGRELKATAIALADQIAAAGDLVRTKTSRTPIALVRGLSRYVTAADGPGIAELIRPPHEDLFT